MINFQIQDNRIHFGGLELDKPTKKGQKAGIAVLEGLEAEIQKKLGLAVDIKTPDGKTYTINKKSRNKWLARTSQFTAFSGQKLGTWATGHFSKSHKRINKAFNEAIGKNSEAAYNFLENHARSFEKEDVDYNDRAFSVENLKEYFKDENRAARDLDDQVHHRDLGYEGVKALFNNAEIEAEKIEAEKMAKAKANAEVIISLLAAKRRDTEEITNLLAAKRHHAEERFVAKNILKNAAEKKDLEAKQITPFNKKFAKKQKAAAKIQAFFKRIYLTKLGKAAIKKAINLRSMSNRALDNVESINKSNDTHTPVSLVGRLVHWISS